MKTNLTENKKKYIINGVLVGVVTLLAIFYLIHNNTITVESIKLLNLSSIFFPLGLVVLSVLICAFICYFAYKPLKKDWTYKYAIGDIIFGNLGSKITPFKVGHFPFRVYFQSKFQFKFYESLTCLTKAQLIYSVASVLMYGFLTIFLAIKGYSTIVFDINVPFYLVFLIGFLFHLGSITLCMLLSFCIPLQDFIIKLLAKINLKFKKIDNVEQFCEYEKLKMKVYKEQVTDMFNHFFYYFPFIFVYFVQMFVSCTVPYVSYLALSGNAFSTYDFFYFYMLFITMTYANNVIPIPGGSGSAELLFSAVFSVAIPSALLGTTLISWRLCTFYIPIIFDFIFFLITINFKSKKPLNNKLINN